MKKLLQSKKALAATALALLLAVSGNAYAWFVDAGAIVGNAQLSNLGVLVDSVKLKSDEFKNTKFEPGDGDPYNGFDPIVADVTVENTGDLNVWLKPDAGMTITQLQGSIQYWIDKEAVDQANPFIGDWAERYIDESQTEAREFMITPAGVTARKAGTKDAFVAPTDGLKPASVGFAAGEDAYVNDLNGNGVFWKQQRVTKDIYLLMPPDAKINSDLSFSFLGSRVAPASGMDNSFMNAPFSLSSVWKGTQSLPGATHDMFSAPGVAMTDPAAVIEDNTDMYGWLDIGTEWFNMQTGETKADPTGNPAPIQPTNRSLRVNVEAAIALAEAKIDEMCR